jgi:Polyketide cyclase / dehydrase and lipid transport
MRIVKRILAGLVIVAAVLVVVAFLLPRYATVFRSTEINAPVSAIYPIVSDLRRFNEWSPWAELDPNAEITFTGPTDGVGQTMRWHSDNPGVGSGSQTIALLEPNREVETSLDFGSQGTAMASIDLEPSGSTTKVTWGFTSDLGFNPVARYFGLMFDKWIGADYERGLAKLKAVAEAAKPDQPAPSG